MYVGACHKFTENDVVRYESVNIEGGGCLPSRDALALCPGSFIVSPLPLFCVYWRQATQ